MTIFKFNIWFDCDPETKQERYVVANTEKEAINKLEAYREELINNGFSDFKYAGGWVEISGVIS